MTKLRDFVKLSMQRSIFFNKTVGPLLRVYSFFKKKWVNKNFQNNGPELLAYFKDCLDKHQLKFWLINGTLLGAYREKRLLTHDLDLDVAMFAEDRQQVQAALEAGGFKLIHEFGVSGEGIKEHAYSYKNVKIDVFFTEKENNSFISYIFYKEVYTSVQNDFKVIKLILPETGFVEYDFLGGKYLIPEKTKECLIANYGENFMIPDKSWDYTKDIPSAVYYKLEEKQGYHIQY